MFWLRRSLMFIDPVSDVSGAPEERYKETFRSSGAGLQVQLATINISPLRGEEQARQLMDQCY